MGNWQAEPVALDTCELIGVRADGTEQALGKVRIPAKMKARELVQEQFGPIDEDGCNDAALAMYACEQLIAFMNAAPSAPVGDGGPAHPDTERLDWLTQMTVNVRVPLRYGSKNLFWSRSEERDGDADGPSDIRAKIDAARAAQAKGGE